MAVNINSPRARASDRAGRRARQGAKPRQSRPSTAPQSPESAAQRVRDREAHLIASAVETIFSASASGISIANSSSKDMTTSTASRLSRPRSFMKCDVAVT